MTTAQLEFRNGVTIGEPLEHALRFLANDFSYRTYDSTPIAPDNQISEADVRIANRINGRISAAEVKAILGRRQRIEAALALVPSDSSLTASAEEIPWDGLHALYAAMSDIQGVGLAKMTKVLHKKRPALIPMLDSVVVAYLRAVDDIPTGHSSDVALALHRSYKVELDANLTTIQWVQRELHDAGYDLSECRILDLFTWAYSGVIRPGWDEGPRALAQPDEVEKLCIDLGLQVSDDGRAILTAAIGAVGAARTRHELRRWLDAAQ